MNEIPQSTRRQFIARTAAASVVVATSSLANEKKTSGLAFVHGAGAKIKSVVRREEMLVRYGGNGDNWHMSWASDDRQYVSLCDGSGFSVPPKALYNSRILSISDGPRDAKFHDLAGYPMLGRPTQKRNDPRYYGFGTLAIDGHIFQFLSTFNRALGPDDLARPDVTDVMRFVGVKLICSPDSGQTWRNQDGSTPVVWESWGQRSRDTMVFFEEEQEAFSLLSILQMGRNYEFNRDGFVYVYAPNGNAEGGMNELVMFRVPKGKLLHRGSYEYFAGRRRDNSARWTKDINARGVVHVFPRGWVNKLVHPYAWHPSVVYNAPLGVYMMANWGMGAATDGMWFGKASYLGFWIAKDPWGPWDQIHEETAWLPAGDRNARAYQPQIAPKWIAADGKSFWLVWTDFQVTDKDLERLVLEDYKRTASAHTDDEADVIRSATRMRQYRPYYAFNAQRVDLTLA